MIRDALRAFAVFTLVAGAVGIARHRRDTVRVRRGDLPPASAAADLPPTGPAGPLGEWLAAWVPSAPTTVPGRVTAALWAAPLTLPGIAIALLSGARPRWSDTHQCLVAVGVGGPSGLALRSVGADANAIGAVILCRRPDPPRSLLAHEVVHVRQAERLGPLLLVGYLWLAARYGYRDHPLERAARTGARAFLSAG